MLATAAFGCAAQPPPPPAPPPPAPQPVSVVTAPQPPPPQKHYPYEDWNIFPDPTTGLIDIYHKGEYVGTITGNEPADEDPPIPRKLRDE